MTHSLVYRLGYYKITVLITWGYHKAIILVFVINTWIVIPVNKYEFFSLSFHAWCLVLMHITSIAFYVVQDNTDVDREFNLRNDVNIPYGWI